MGSEWQTTDRRRTSTGTTTKQDKHGVGYKKSTTTEITGTPNQATNDAMIGTENHMQENPETHTHPDAPARPMSTRQATERKAFYCASSSTNVTIKHMIITDQLTDSTDGCCELLWRVTVMSMDGWMIMCSAPVVQLAPGTAGDQ